MTTPTGPTRDELVALAEGRTCDLCREAGVERVAGGEALVPDLGWADVCRHHLVRLSRRGALTGGLS